MTIARPLAAVTFVAMLLVASTAWADEFAEHLEEGTRAFSEGDYEAALLAFEKARSLRDLPVARFNIARSYEEMGECSAARLQYRVLAETPDLDPEIKAAVEERVADLATCDEEPPAQPPTSVDAPEQPPEETSENAREEPPEESAEPRPAPDATASRATDRPRGGVDALPIVGWSLLGTGTVVFTAMLVEHFANRSRARAGFDEIGAPYDCGYSLADDRFIGPSCDAEAARTDSRYQPFLADVERARTRSAIVLPVSGAVMAVGAGLLVYAYVIRSKPNVAIVPWLGSRGPAGASLRLDF